MCRYIVLAICIVTQTINAQKSSLPPEVEKNVQARIAEGIHPSIVIGIVDKDGPRYFSYGNTRSGGTPVSNQSIYEIGSITKCFTATLLADLVLKGKMKVDDPVSKYLPSDVHTPVYPEGGPVISLGHLSDHTSSLPGFPATFTPSDPGNPFAGMTLQDVYNFLDTYTLPREVGSQYEYSNLAVGLLGKILTQAYGTTYDAAVQDIICKPLRMKETAITLTKEMKENLAYGHAMGIEVDNWDLPALEGAGALRSSVYDILIFLSANMGLKKTDLYEAMLLTHEQRHDKANGGGVGLGWHIAKGNNEPIYWHTGGTGGYRTFCGFTKDQKTGVVVMTNCDVGVADIGFHLLDPASPLGEVKPLMVSWIRKDIEQHGAVGFEKRYNDEKAVNPAKYEINEDAINALGYDYMNRSKLTEALAVFQINLKEFPNSSNVYDSYGEALMKSGRKEEAITNYQKSLELNPGNSNAVIMLEAMGVTTENKEVYVPVEILETYLGTYELAPGFNIVISHEGMRLFGQATGQSQFELFPISNTEFYLKVVEAKVVFNTSADGVVSMTLLQNGAVMPGRKL